MKLTRVLGLFWLLGALSCTGGPSSQTPALRVVAPDLTQPLIEELPSSSAPKDPIRAAILKRINRDRAQAGVPAVAWDEAAAAVANAFCLRQIGERSHGHYLMDGVPPYARTGLAGIFGVGAENAASWATSGVFAPGSAEELALSAHQQMMSEKPPADGHRKTILDPEATHVGVGYALLGGRFRMAQEFSARRLRTLQISQPRADRALFVIQGKTLSPHRLRFVTVAREPPPRPISREEANGRTSYSYPKPFLSFIPEGMRRRVEVIGTLTQPRVQVKRNLAFSFRFAPEDPGLWTLVFYTAASGNPARPGGAATIWVE